MIGDPAGRIPRGLAVEDYIADWQVGDSLGNGRVVLEQPVARIKLHVGAVFEREHPDSIELPLEDPLGAREPLLRKGRRHWHNPFGEGCCFLVYHAIDFVSSGRTSRPIFHFQRTVTTNTIAGVYMPNG